MGTLEKVLCREGALGGRGQGRHRARAGSQRSVEREQHRRWDQVLGVSRCPAPQARWLPPGHQHACTGRALRAASSQYSWSPGLGAQPIKGIWVGHPIPGHLTPRLVILFLFSFVPLLAQLKPWDRDAPAGPPALEAVLSLLASPGPSPLP